MVSQWPHNTGPIMTYMAACEGTTCDKFNSTNAKWFKIDQAGQNANGSGWVQAEISKHTSATTISSMHPNKCPRCSGRKALHAQSPQQYCSWRLPHPARGTSSSFISIKLTEVLHRYSSSHSKSRCLWVALSFTLLAPKCGSEGAGTVHPPPP